MAEPLWYGIIDCAADPRLIDLVRASPSHLCLFKGKNIAPEVMATAPWLVRLDADGQALAVWQQHGRDKNWGIMVCSALPINELQRHFRRFLQAKLPDGTVVLFRFYDPRVFSTYMPAATPEERAPWFDGVVQYTVELASGATHQFRMHEGRLFDGAQPLG